MVFIEKNGEFLNLRIFNWKKFQNTTSKNSNLQIKKTHNIKEWLRQILKFPTTFRNPQTA